MRHEPDNNEADFAQRPGDDVLDSAVAALREQRAADGPSPLVSQRTLAVLWAAEARAQHQRSGWVMRIAAAIVLGVSAAAVVLVARQYRHAPQIVKSDSGVGGLPAVAPPRHVSNRNVDNQDSDTHEQTPVESAAPSATLVQPVSYTLSPAVAVTGHVYYNGAPPPRRPIDLSACPQCLQEVAGPLYDDSLVVNEDGTIQNVVVSISGGLPRGERSPAPASPIVLDQKYCTFQPHVIAAVVGQQMILRNSDRLLHSSHAMDSEATPLFNFALPGVAERHVEPFQTVETFKIKCDLHPWMSAWVRVLPNPYFDVTRGDGAFAIRDLPPGTYTIKAWQEVLGVIEKQITVTGGEPIVVDFTYQPR